MTDYKWDARHPAVFPGAVIVNNDNGLCRVLNISMVKHPTESWRRPCLEVERLSSPEQGSYYLPWNYSSWTIPLAPTEWTR